MESEDSGGACRPLDVLRDPPAPGFRAELRAARRLPPGLPPACGRASCQSPAGRPLLGLRLLASPHAAPFLCNAHPLPANLNSPFNSRRRRRFSEELSLTVPSPHTTVPLPCTSLSPSSSNCVPISAHLCPVMGGVEAHAERTGRVSLRVNWELRTAGGGRGDIT